MKKLIAFKDLKPMKGIGLSAQQIRRLEKRGLFPPPLKMGAGTSINQWPEDVIDDHIAARFAEAQARQKVMLEKAAEKEKAKAARLKAEQSVAKARRKAAKSDGGQHAAG